MNWRFLALAAALHPSFALGQDISPLQGDLSALCGAKAVVSGEGATRSAYVECRSRMQGVHVIGPGAEPVAVEATVDLRPKNTGDSHVFMVKVMRNLLDDKDWPEGQCFIESCLKKLYVPEAKERRFGAYSMRLERTSDVMMTMIIAKGAKAYHPALDPWK
ncbi:hypothetical protein CU669_13455 [Paramagnetospirillum kuznetsovii]|uniref:Uncharacterized protein n=1 Tax=Paramagnetospirillum kuznetsovii TaxID=2053833 RepID=A0A364NWH3_9PROT|nr:hypothetical protein [Paramagnetospirillum kuznetsovii]RAU21428.1 hypothetical protein CU669_13455 [Paramagnetospirillum kuznetsovii]